MCTLCPMVCKCYDKSLSSVMPTLALLSFVSTCLPPLQLKVLRSFFSSILFPSVFNFSLHKNHSNPAFQRPERSCVFFVALKTRALTIELVLAGSEHGYDSCSSEEEKDPQTLAITRPSSQEGVLSVEAVENGRNWLMGLQSRGAWTSGTQAAMGLRGWAD